jgi:hypothetical protein
MAGHAQGMSRTGPPTEPPWDYAGLFGIERDRLSELLSGLEARGILEAPAPGTVTAEERSAALTAAEGCGRTVALVPAKLLREHPEYTRRPATWPGRSLS